MRCTILLDFVHFFVTASGRRHDLPPVALAHVGAQGFRLLPSGSSRLDGLQGLQDQERALRCCGVLRVLASCLTARRKEGPLSAKEAYTPMRGRQSPRLRGVASIQRAFPQFQRSNLSQQSSIHKKSAKHRQLVEALDRFRVWLLLF